MSERNEVLDLLKKDVRPRFLLESMTWSKSNMLGSFAGFVSRSWINWLKPV